MKKPKLYSAFDGDAAGLRDILVERFTREADEASTRAQTEVNGSYEQGIKAGECHAYRNVARFLKKLVVNKIEHPDGSEPTP